MTSIRLGRFSEIDPNGLVPLVNKISRLGKCEPKSTHFRQTVAFGGGLAEMGAAGAGRRLA